MRRGKGKKKTKRENEKMCRVMAGIKRKGRREKKKWRGEGKREMHRVGKNVGVKEREKNRWFSVQFKEINDKNEHL